MENMTIKNQYIMNKTLYYEIVVRAFDRIANFNVYKKGEKMMIESSNSLPIFFFFF